MHSNNIKHRDIKPTNIFLKGHNYAVQVGDLGIAAKYKKGVQFIE